MIKTSIIKKLSFFIVILLFISCDKDDQIENKEIPASDHFVGLAEIEAIAGGIEFPDGNDSKLKSTGPQTKSISSINEIKNEGEETLFYIVNYDEGGFILLSSDKRSIPVLAYSTDNNFEVDEYSYPSGVKVWMDDAKKQIESIKSSGSEQSHMAKKSWESIQQALIGEVSSLKKEPIPDCWEHTEIITRGPIDDVPTWGQEYPYNTEMPNRSCPSPDTMQQHYVGCVPLSMAVVMRYHEHPTSYTWNSMPLGSGNSTIAAFLDDIHDDIKYETANTQPDYKCNGTGVNLNKPDEIFTDHYEYTSATHTSFNHNSIKNDIVYDRPVIFYGTDEYDPSDKHTWVCDGYKEFVYYDDDCNSWSSMSYHMAWGYGTAANGWFSYGSFNMGVYYLNDDLEMIYNIIP